MKILSSPAKLMSLDNDPSIFRSSTPKFIDEASLIQKYLKEKSPKYLQKLMSISTKLADENWDRNQIWKSRPNKEESSAALYAFKGEVYRGLDAKTLGEQECDYLQKNFRMISGLYGLLKPSDKIMLYRLEMGRNFEFSQYKNLYEYWREKVTDQLNSELKKDEPILNLASTEYFKVFDAENLKGKIINFHFYEIKSGEKRQVVVYTKHARGLMIRYCAQNNTESLEELKKFNLENYIFDDELSTENKFTFVR